MKRSVSAPITPENLGPQRLQMLLPCSEIRRPTDRENRRMFTQQESVWNVILLPKPRQLAL
jgi:hypothetical protein